MARRSTAACKAASRAPLCVPPATSVAVARFQRRMRAVGSTLEGAAEAIADTAVRSEAATSGAARMRRSTVLSAAPTSAGGQGAYLRNVVDVVIVDAAVDSQYSTKSAFWTWSYLQKLNTTKGSRHPPASPDLEHFLQLVLKGHWKMLSRRTPCHPRGLKRALTLQPVPREGQS
jgi:hypothetical protein